MERFFYSWEEIGNGRQRDPGRVAIAWNPGWQRWPFRGSKIKSMVSLLLNVTGLPPTQRPATRNFLCDCSLVKWVTGQSWIFTHELKTEESTCYKRWEEKRRKKPWAFSSSYSQSPGIGRTEVSKGRYWSGHMHYRWIVGHKGLRLQSMFEDTEAQKEKWLGQGCSALVKELVPELKLSPYVIPSSTLCKHLCP